MRAPIFLPLLALAAASCGGEEGSDEPVGNPSSGELHNRIENVAFVQPEEEAEKAAPRRLGVLQEAALPAEYRAGRSCRLTQGANLLLVAATPGAIANIDGRIMPLRIAGPVGPSGGFFEAAGASVSIGLQPPAGAAVGSPTTHAGVTVGGNDSKPIERHEASWICLG
jgi:hypothetical protein